MQVTLAYNHLFNQLQMCSTQTLGSVLHGLKGGGLRGLHAEDDSGVLSRIHFLTWMTQLMLLILALDYFLN